MKRHLKNNRYQLSDTEREGVWQGIRRDIHTEQRGHQSGPRTWRPALGLAAAVALLVVMGSWYLGSRNPQGIFGGGDDIVVVDAGPQVGDMAVVELTEENTPVEVDPADAPSTMALNRQAAPKSEAKPAARERTWNTETVAMTSLNDAESPARMTVTGRVRDAVTGDPLPHATILVRGTSTSAVADSNGYFTLTGLDPSNEIAVQVMMLGYNKVEQVMVLSEAGEMTVAYDLQPITVAALEEQDAPEVKTLERYAIDPADEAKSKEGGVVMRAGELNKKDGRTWGTPAPQARSESVAQGSVTGGTKPPNGEEVELMYFDHVGVNPFVATDDDSLSTFALDVDNASWTMARSYLERGMMPPKDAIRVEEFVNAFDAGWKSQSDDVFRIHTDGGTSRFGAGYHLLRIGVVGQSVDASERKPANLVFVIDISGSMDRENRLGAVKKALHVLLGELNEGDSVGLVVYGSQGEVRLAPTDISDREKILQAIDALGTGGSTNVYEGLDLAYRMARDHYEAGKLNRLILCSDGVANNGASTRAEEILDLVRKASDESITLSAIGFGMGNYNDVLMEKLADSGDGNYYYVDKHEEAERVFRENLTGLLQTIAREVKVQVEFDPEAVTRWRLLGYENRDVADRDFRNDAVDAGEVGAGHQVTALYEVKLKPSPDPDRNAAVIRLRHEAPAHDSARAGQVEEIEVPVPMKVFAGDYGAGSPWRRTQMVAAEFAEILRHSYWARESRLADLVPLADALVKELPGDAAVQDLAAMIRLATDIEAGQGDE